MNRIMLIAIALLCPILVFAAPARAQAPTTMDEFKAVVLDGLKTGQAMNVVQSNITDVTNRWNGFAQRAKYHQEHPCYYEPGHPEQCAAYDQEAADLTAEGNRLIAEHDGYVAQLGFLTSHFGIVMARLRLAKFFTTFAPWVERVQNCARMKSPMAAYACLVSAWEEHP